MSLYRQFYENSTGNDIFSFLFILNDNQQVSCKYAYIYKLNYYWMRTHTKKKSAWWHIYALGIICDVQ